MATDYNDIPNRLKREFVVGTAKSICDNGGHYLWAAVTDGKTPMVTPNLLGDDDEHTCVWAASLDGAAKFACAGRPNHPDVQALPKGDLDAIDSADPEAFRWPRYWRDGDTKHPRKSCLSWGESCRGKLHFDCGGFVRNCFRQVLGVAIIPVNFGMRASCTCLNPGKEALPTVEIWPADILFTEDFSHVGLATGGWPVLSNYAIHAWYAMVGVVKTPMTDAAPAWCWAYRWPTWGDDLPEFFQ